MPISGSGMEMNNAMRKKPPVSNSVVRLVIFIVKVSVKAAYNTKKGKIVKRAAFMVLPFWV
jgi:hypothetical protein